MDRTMKVNMDKTMMELSRLDLHGWPRLVGCAIGKKPISYTAAK